IYTAIIISCIVIGIIMTYLFISIIRQQRRNLELQKENILAEISAMERERSRIAGDLHDDLGPILSAIKFNIDNVDLNKPESHNQLIRASEYIDDSINRMRKIAKHLMPVALERKGLIIAIHEFVTNIEESSNLKIIFTSHPIPELDRDKEINIYRIVQEVVQNTLKHAGATKLTIELSTRSNNLVLLFKDNGTGFDYHAKLKESAGIGLKSLKSRTHIMGGKIIVESKQQVGTAQLFEIPFK
ncbi:MAG TPA: ATP-binding protein, partial [Flavisolibacter sp.]|nr:ATP-binding protein [Flavisolibacter sp.]